MVAHDTVAKIISMGPAEDVREGASFCRNCEYSAFIPPRGVRASDLFRVSDLRHA
jgi:hypothetical protein